MHNNTHHNGNCQVSNNGYTGYEHKYECIGFWNFTEYSETGPFKGPDYYDKHNADQCRDGYLFDQARGEQYKTEQE